MRGLREISLPTALEVTGVVVLTVGVAVIWWPAGLIVGGLAAVFLAQGVNR